MRQVKVTWLIILGLVFQVSCKYDALQDEPTPIGLEQTWINTSLQTVYSTVPCGFTPEHRISITFKSDQTFLLNLDTNTCIGEYSSDNNNIFISPLGCTKKCCDSEFSIKILELLPGVDSYTIRGSELTLWISGGGFIKWELKT